MRFQLLQNWIRWLVDCKSQLDGGRASFSMEVTDVPVLTRGLRSTNKDSPLDLETGCRSLSKIDKTRYYSVSIFGWVMAITLASVRPHVGRHEASKTTPPWFATPLVVTIPTTYEKKNFLICHKEPTSQEFKLPSRKTIHRLLPYDFRMKYLK